MAVYAYAREIDVTIRIKGENGRPMPHVAAWYDNTGGQIFSDDAGILKLTVTEGTPITLVKENEYMRQVIADREDLTVIMDASCRILGTGFNEFITKRTSAAAVDGVVAADFEGHTQPQIMRPPVLPTAITLTMTAAVAASAPPMAWDMGEPWLTTISPPVAKMIKIKDQ